MMLYDLPMDEMESQARTYETAYERGWQAWHAADATARRQLTQAHREYSARGYESPDHEMGWADGIADAIIMSS